MSKTYTELPKLIDLLFRNSDHPAYWQQEPYKTDFFRLFVAEPELHGDNITDRLREGWLKTTDRPDEKKEIMLEICSAWNEWQYAKKHLAM